MSDFSRYSVECVEEMEAAEEAVVRFGGAQGDDDDEEKRKIEERERKKAEVRARLAEDSMKKKAKKGFLTPERKKKLRKLLMLKAAEDLKQQQMMKEQERKRILEERCPPLPNVDGIDDQGQLQKIADDLHKKFCEVIEVKYDIEFKVRAKEHEINELTIAVNDLRGKFVKPTLKKVSKYDNKFKSKASEDKVDFRANLKETKKVDSFLEELKAAEAVKEAAPEDRFKKQQASAGPKPDFRASLKKAEIKDKFLEELKEELEGKEADAQEAAEE